MALPVGSGPGLLRRLPEMIFVGRTRRYFIKYTVSLLRRCRYRFAPFFYFGPFSLFVFRYLCNAERGVGAHGTSNL